MISIVVTSVGYFGEHIVPLVSSFTRFGDPEIIISMTTKSRAEATNGAMRAATGDWIMVLDNDVRCKGDYGFIESLDPHNIYGPDLHPNKLGQGVSWLNEWCIIIPREVYLTVGGFDEEFKASMPYGGADYCLRVQQQRGKVVQIDAPFIHLEAATKRDNPLHGDIYWENLCYLQKKWGLPKS